jgi:hypothetical protein
LAAGQADVAPEIRAVAAEYDRLLQFFVLNQRSA